MEAAQVSINGWMGKEDTMYIYDGILFSHKKNEILPFAMMWMELECIMLSKISQSEKDKYICFHSYVEFKKQNNQGKRETSQETALNYREQTNGYQRGGG